MPMKLAPNQFIFYFVTTDILEEEEVLVFPMDSLISEFGGALGLFLGVSFLGILTLSEAKPPWMLKNTVTSRKMSIVV